ncbi:N-acetylglucosamine-6-phosphate deacetylase [Cohnella silvisoli]|uniref:N-acetylglucosamine-6-phosphate deacetylase n=1 Tax=Cohnella silvisoli TaxID=2873699 RepID=A0ABV1KWZ8_9BACL|nr:N-acetylglucosamine-6-phosphate deacetylase [Cohnella silvisoli]MCD9024033.1 N-acetylglucosamine-6-phosphate deacetylase [Cohnella silvisoli]
MKWRGMNTGTGCAVEVTARNGIITDISQVEEAEGMAWISPGWIDLQVNGFAGFDFNGDSVTSDDVLGVSKALHSKGVTAYLPTVVTGDHDQIKRSMKMIASVKRSDSPVRESIYGIHLEGPYISSEDGPRGAHPKQHVRKPDWEEFLRFQDAADGLIRMVTIAPETEGALSFIEKLVKHDIIVCIGHTMANEQQLKSAVEAGATVSTHLGNGSHTILPRHPNYIWSQLAEDRLWATFIPDGHHLHPAVIKAMVRAKRDKAILVSDCVKFGGMPPGRYQSVIGDEVELREDGRLSTAANPDILAGSAYSLDRGITGAIRYTDMDLREAIEAVTVRPGRALGASSLGRLEVGCPAQLTLFDYDEQTYAISVRETVVAGCSVYAR